MKKSVFIAIFLCFCLAPAALLRAATDTSTPTATPTSSPTFTLTPTPPGPGQGSYSVAPSTLVSGPCNASLEIDFTVGAIPFTTGLISIWMPPQFDPPTSANFFLLSSQASFHGALQSYSGNTYTVQVTSVASGETLRFLYGYNTCVNVNPPSPTAFLIKSSPYSTDPAKLQPLSGQPVIVINTPTATRTTTPTATMTPSFTHSPTISPTFSVTMTYTITPIAPTESAPFTYPNPFDIRHYDKVTFLFPYDTGVDIEIFNLAGETVVKSIKANPANKSTDLKGGWAIWDGRDDHGHLAAGGLYFYRLKGDSRMWTGKMTVIH